MTFYRVVVPLDGSRLAEKALGEALSLTNKMGHILLVTAIDYEAPPKVRGIPMYPFMGMGMAYIKEPPSKINARHRTYLMEKVAMLRARGFRADYEIRGGHPKAVIVQVAADFNADVIVMASHGRSGISRQVLGSVAGDVSSESKRPVMVIPVAKAEGQMQEAGV